MTQTPSGWPQRYDVRLTFTWPSDLKVSRLPFQSEATVTGDESLRLSRTEVFPIALAPLLIVGPPPALVLIFSFSIGPLSEFSLLHVGMVVGAAIIGIAILLAMAHALVETRSVLFDLRERRVSFRLARLLRDRSCGHAVRDAKFWLGPATAHRWSGFALLVECPHRRMLIACDREFETLQSRAVELSRQTGIPLTVRAA